MLPKKFFLKIFLVPFNGWGSTISKLQSHFEETVYFLRLCPQEYLVLISFISDGWKVESTLEPLSGFEPGAPWLGFQVLKHQIIVSTPDPKILGSNPNYMLGQALGPNLIPRLSGTFGSYKIKSRE